MVSVNTVIKALIESRLANNNFEKYPFSSALLLYTLVTHDKQSINLDKIVDWAYGFLTEKTEKQTFHKNKDKEISAFFLIYYILKTEKLKEIPTETETVLADLYTKNYSSQKLFFTSFVLSSVIQFSASLIKKDLPNYSDNSKHILEKYLAEKPFNASLASIFLMLHNGEQVLYDKIKSHFPSVTKYEDKTNYQYAMWLHEKQSITEKEFKEIDDTVSAIEPPLLADLYNGGDITNFHPSKFEHTNAKLSPFYISILYCLRSELDDYRKTVTDKHIDTKYKTGIFSRIGGLLVGLIILPIGCYAIWYSITKYIEMQRSINLPHMSLFLFGTAIVYPIAFTLLFDLLIKGKPDRRIFAIMRERFINHWIKTFFISIVVLSVILGIIVNYMSNWPLL